MKPPKKSSLQAALNHLPSVKEGEGTEQPIPAEKPPKAHRKPSRKDTVFIGTHVPKATAKLLRLLAAEEDTTNQALILEALELLFLKKGKEDLGV